MRLETKRKLFASHPDTNGGDYSRVLELQKTLSRCKETQPKLHIGEGFRVMVKGVWWDVNKKQYSGFFWCSRKNRVGGGFGHKIEAQIHRDNITDARCGPKFRYRMILA